MECIAWPNSLKKRFHFLMIEQRRFVRLGGGKLQIKATVGPLISPIRQQFAFDNADCAK